MSRSRRDAALIIWARGLRTGAMGILVVLVAPYLDLIGFDAPAIGLIFTLSLVGGVALAVPATLVGDRFGRRRLFVLLSLVNAVAGLGLVLSESFAWLAVGAFFGAYAASGTNVGPLLQLEQTGLPEVSPRERRTTAFARLGVVSSAGVGLGNLAAAAPPLIVVALVVSEVDSFRLLFALYAALNFVSTGLYLFLSPAIEVRWSGRARFVNPVRTRSRGRIWGLSALFGVDSFAGGLVADTFVSFWLVKHFGLGVEMIGPVFLGARVLDAISLWIAPYIARRIGLLNTMVWTQVIANGLLLAFGLAPYAWLAITLWLARAFWNEMDVPTRQSYSMAVVDSEERMAMAGAANMGRAGMRVPSPAVTGWIWASAITATPFVIGVGIKLAYNAALWRAFRAVTPPEEEEVSRKGAKTQS